MTTGQFLPLEGANPATGEVGKPEHVEEDRVEVLVLAQPTAGSGSASAAANAQSKSEDGGVKMGAVLQELKKVRRSLGTVLVVRTRSEGSTLRRCIRMRRSRMMCIGSRISSSFSGGWIRSQKFRIGLGTCG